MQAQVKRGPVAGVLECLSVLPSSNIPGEEIQEVWGDTGFSESLCSCIQALIVGQLTRQIIKRFVAAGKLHMRMKQL